MKDLLWKVKAYIEYEIEAPDEEEAIQRLTDCIIKDLDDGVVDIRDIAEVSVDRITDRSIED